MAENPDGSGGSLPNEKRCKRNDGRGWRCWRPVVEGRCMCETHLQQSRHRHRHEPVPYHLKLERSNKKFKLEIDNDGGEGLRKSPLKWDLRKRKSEISVDVGEEKPIKIDELKVNGDEEGSKLGSRRSERKRKLSWGVDFCKADVKDLKFGTVKIGKASASSVPTVKNAGSGKVKDGGSCSKVEVRKPIRSKNAVPVPFAISQDSPNVKAKAKASSSNAKASSKAKASAKKKSKCHWCRWRSYRVLVLCSVCKKNYFCDDCIKNKVNGMVTVSSVRSRCPVCEKSCECRPCVRERSKEVKAKGPVINIEEKNVEENKVEENKAQEHEVQENNVEENAVEENVVEENAVEENKVDKSQRLYMINLLLPFLEQVNQEKMVELDKEAKIQGKSHNELQIDLPIDSQKQKFCGFCKSCIVDAYRSCKKCSYILCMFCCQELRDGYLQEKLKDLQHLRLVRSKSSCEILWKEGENGSISCPPRNIGGCEHTSLDLQCLNAFSWTKDLEASAKQIVSDYNFTSPEDVDSMFCVLCDVTEGGNCGEASVGNKVLYFSTKKEFLDRTPEHFKHHWARGQPLVIRNVLKSKQELCWDPAFLFCAYLERSRRSLKDAEAVKSKTCPDWCEIEMGRKQIFVGAKTHKNVWNDVLKFKVWFSSGFFQEKFPKHYAALMDALPFKEYMNSSTGLLNVAAKLPNEVQDSNFGPFVYISYAGQDEILGAKFSTKLCSHAYDMVNILVHSTDRTISEKKLGKVKDLINKYNSRVQNASFSNELGQEPGFESRTNGEITHVPDGEVSVLSSDGSSIGGDSDDEDFQIGSSSFCTAKDIHDIRGAQWDIFRREDVPKLVKFLREYSDELNLSYCSPKKVDHPILDECFYLNAFHMRILKEEFDIEPWTIHQDIGEAVIVPAGCPYQVKKIKSCVNVVLEFMSPESALESVKLSDEIRRLPYNHKAKGKMLEVKKMVIYGINETIEGIRNVSQAETSGKIRE